MMTDTDDSGIIGKVARVTARITNARVGEVRVGVRGGSEDYLAIPADAEEVLELNTPAVIVDLLLPRTAIVRKMNHF